ncbi:MAG: transketolase [Thermodesulfovibrionales bacterium]
MNSIEMIEYLKKKADWVKRETLKIHKIAPGIRLASSLSCIEILTALYYGRILNYDPKNIYAGERDRFIISKAHGSVSFYPILADLGYFDKKYLEMVGKPGSILGDIPDCSIPGYETVNGSLGHGLGVACGMALALKQKGRKEKVFVLSGDGELYEGSVWEAIMFAAHHNLNNLVLIIDNNKICMLDYCKNILNLEPIDAKFSVFNWKTTVVDGHNLEQLYPALLALKQDESNGPKVLIADTVKGKGVPRLETDSLCHIKALRAEEIDQLLGEK